MSHPEIIVVGAGAAGIGAGLELAKLGVPFLIIEAADRIGGRAFTDRESLPYIWDRGCHWLHCANVNPLVPLADTNGAEYHRHHTTDDRRGVWAKRRWLDKAGAAAGKGALEIAFSAIYHAGKRGLDVPANEVLPDAGEWAPLVWHWVQLMASADPDQISTLGYSDYDDTGHNWPVRSGYGSLIASLARDLPIRLGMPVTHVHQRSDGVTLTTPAGAIEAKAAIITASTNVLTSGAIRFTNGPAKDLLDHVADVPCGSYEKIAIAFDHSPFGDFGKDYVMIMDDAGGYPINFQLSHCGAPLAMGEIGGSRAREMSEAGDCAMIDFALERLVQGFGSDLRKSVMATAVTRWATNPYTRGAYSYARVGTGHRRRAMIETDTGSVVFAGEAFSHRWQATAHGAFTSGREVARRLVQAGKVRVGS